MFIQETSVPHHQAEADLLKQALQGDRESRRKIFLYLSAADPRLRQIMQTAIHNDDNPRLWKQLLSCLAIQCWGEHMDSDRRVDQEASQRIDQSITDVFVEDWHEWEESLKNHVLHKALQEPQVEFRYASAYLLGLRGEDKMIPMLDEILNTAVKSWKVRAVQALAAIGEERCATPLIKALVMDRGALHSEAGRALQDLGPLAEKAWRVALSHPDSHIRWHAARSLGESADNQSIEILAEGLSDNSHKVRWATADVLAHIGPRAVPATLKVISRSTLSAPTRQAAYHALHGVLSRRLRERLKPILEALQSPTASIEAPAIAHRLLQEWEKLV